MSIFLYNSLLFAVLHYQEKALVGANGVILGKYGILEVYLGKRKSIDVLAPQPRDRRRPSDAES